MNKCAMPCSNFSDALPLIRSTDCFSKAIIKMFVSLRHCLSRLRLDRMPTKMKERIKPIQGSLTYRDKRLAGFDAATVVEIIEHLDKGRIEEAREYYKRMLALAADNSDVLMMISGDLGKHGYLSDIFDLILPIYSPERHDVMLGINLLQAFLQTKKIAEGEKLLHKLFELNRPDITQHLMFYSEQFEKMKESAEKTQLAISEPLEISAMLFTYPIWVYGLKQADWLFADSVERKRKIGFLVLANTTRSGISEPTQQKEDDTGRLTRSIPLFLASVYSSPLTRAFNQLCLSSKKVVQLSPACPSQQSI